MDGKNRLSRGDKSPNETLNNYKNFEVAVVISITDNEYLGRIKVRIKGPRNMGGDDGIPDEELPWAFPMIPKFISTQPKVGEGVFVFVFTQDRQHADRVYFGPIISQPQLLNYDPYYFSALAGFTFSTAHPNVNVAKIPQLNGIFPDPQDISIQGRFNTDITQKRNEIVIRAGKFVESKPDKNNPYPFKYNASTQAYIQIKNDVQTKAKTDENEAERGTITNIVANKINLLTHKDGSPRFNLTNSKDLISDEEMASILETAHQMVFGDILVQYLILLKEAVLNHVHNGNGNKATDLTSGKLAVAEFVKKASDLENQMLSKNIRLN